MPTLTDIERRTLELTNKIQKLHNASRVVTDFTNHKSNTTVIDNELILAAEEINSILQAKLNAKVQYFVVFDGKQFWNLSPKEWITFCKEGAKQGTCPLLSPEKATLTAPEGIAHYGTIAMEKNTNVRIVQPHHWDGDAFQAELSLIT
ncbi:hypothetical protein F7U66_01445 [Vibrio parahaemolyticus]|nr:hypothetical protein [Vibrio parahaemolyticus]